jgi:uncharacterized membrane protein YvlD (DUF360 family)
MDHASNEHTKSSGFGRLVVKVLVSSVVLAVTAFLTPNFSIANIWVLLIAAVVIGLIDYLITALTGFDAKPFGRGIVGFLVSAAIIYITGLILPGVHVGIWGAVIAAAVIGAIQALIPATRDTI